MAVTIQRRVFAVTFLLVAIVLVGIYVSAAMNVSGEPFDDQGNAGPWMANTTLSIATWYHPLEKGCVIFDSRYDSQSGPLYRDNVYSMRVYGNLESQGGNPDCGIPDGEAVAISANVLAVDPQGTGFLQLWPYRGSSKGESMVNYTSKSNLNVNLNNGVILSVCNTEIRNCNFDLNIESNQAATHAQVIATGYYSHHSTGLGYTPLDRGCLVLDTRSDNVSGPLRRDVPYSFQVTRDLSGQGGLPDCGIPFGDAQAVTGNILSVDPRGKGNFQLWPWHKDEKGGSLMNYASQADLNVNLNNGIAFPICDPYSSPCIDDMKIESNFANADAQVIVSGYFADPWIGDGLVYVPLPASCKVLDTRYDNVTGKLSQDQSYPFKISGSMSGQGGASNCGIPRDTALAVSANIIAIQPDGKGNFQVWPWGGTRKGASMINYPSRYDQSIDLNNGVVVPVCDYESTTSCYDDLYIESNFTDSHAAVIVTGYFKKP